MTESSTLRRGLIIVIPALNESAVIGSVVKSSVAVAEKVIVVDDGSTDNTGNIAANVGAIVLRHEKPQGYDRSVADGLNRAFKLGALAAVTCDADGQHRLEDVCKVAAPVLAGEAEFSAGIRNHYNRPVEAFVGLFSRLMFGTSDPFCGLKCYSSTFFEKAGPFPNDMHIGTLPFVWIKRQGLRQCFLPIEVRKREDHPRFGTSLRANIKLARAFTNTASSYLRSSSKRL